MKATVAFLAIAGMPVAAACASTPRPVEEPVVITETDAGARHGSECGRACETLAVLDCPEAGDTRGGTSCVVMCLRMVSFRVTPFDPVCIANAKTVNAVRACPSVRCAR